MTATSGDLPVEAMNRFCMICGEIISGNGFYLADEYKEQMIIIFKGEVNIIENVRPTFICYKC